MFLGVVVWSAWLKSCDPVTKAELKKKNTFPKHRVPRARLNEFLWVYSEASTQNEPLRAFDFPFI